jgi:hypothetical protein
MFRQQASARKSYAVVDAVLEMFVVLEQHTDAGGLGDAAQVRGICERLYVLIVTDTHALCSCSA